MSIQPQRVTDAEGRLTGRTDKYEVPLEPTARDVEVLGAHRHAEYMQRRREKIAELEAKEQETRRYQEFEAEFIRHGGDRADAKDAYKRYRSEQAARAAKAADEEARAARRASTLGAV